MISSFLFGVIAAAGIGAALFAFSSQIDAEWRRLFYAPFIVAIAVVDGSVDSAWYAQAGFVFTVLLFGVYVAVLSSLESRKSRVTVALGMLAFHLMTYVAALAN